MDRVAYSHVTNSYRGWAPGARDTQNSWVEERSAQGDGGGTAL